MYMCNVLVLTMDDDDNNNDDDDDDVFISPHIDNKVHALPKQTMLKYYQGRQQLQIKRLRRTCAAVRPWRR